MYILCVQEALGIQYTIFLYEKLSAFEKYQSEVSPALFQAKVIYNIYR